MRDYITEDSPFETNVEILCKCYRLTTTEIYLLLSNPSYIKFITLNSYRGNINITKLLKRNPELMELFI